jgi:tRNA-Thr(GGU) m(6)t(6)A37 methyltransferase TsaA
LSKEFIMQQAPEAMTLKVIAHIHTAFPTKFGIPRQSGLVEELRGEIVFTPEYRNPDALRGLEDFSHIWLVWQFSGAVRESWSPTVRPPRLGGNERRGVFATRSPYRPNALGLSCVELAGVENGELIVRGADLLDGTPIFDIKPYLPYVDAYPDARGGFTDTTKEYALQVVCPNALLCKVPENKRAALSGVLKNDPRPHSACGFPKGFFGGR